MSPIQRVLVLIGTLSLFACDQSDQPPKPVTAPPAASQPSPVESPPAPELPATKPTAPAIPEQPKVEVKEQATKAEEPPPPHPAPATAEQARPLSSAAVELKHESKPLTITLPAKEVRAKVKSPAKLDLSLKPNVFDPLQPVEKDESDHDGLLPPMFGEKAAQESPFQINGKLITNDQQRGDYWDSVEGAQLNFEFKQ
ncbi:hypothetical protein [Pseudomonas sp. 5P_3.1_Bac2]|uniref:hypothetical protein n=1 Tax=Pseudomonas sp. 5P_3.1_Bac2 TaxID=2971617 RepID=UPI0021C7BCA3|nr:hypothetical protein [Pseudomonas sp. 5P_3.1_Bac2]MCU1716718.1 hypothetical protein [Pseudomonas sp. 5P_3.1_Bac2]